MLTADVHTHTKYSHGTDLPKDMYLHALELNLEIYGFSEHSPRPSGYNYSNEYRENLAKNLNNYVSEIQELKNKNDKCLVLFGMEMDWFDNEQDFVRNACKAYDFDYLIGSVHFLDTWGFDDNKNSWETLSQEECEKNYEKYFKSWKNMLSSKLFNIAAHPDLIKIFSINQFHIWLQKKESKKIIKDCLKILKENNMSMEISSAGIRKLCHEIYPTPIIMQMAKELDLQITISSDAHCPKDIAYNFPQLENYAKIFGFNKNTIFNHGQIIHKNF